MKQKAKKERTGRCYTTDFKIENGTTSQGMQGIPRN